MHTSSPPRPTPLRFGTVVSAAVLIASMLAASLAGVPCAWAEAGDLPADARKAFSTAQRSKEPSVREDGYVVLGGYDSAGAVDTMLSALRKEKHASVIFGALRALGSMRSESAMAALHTALSKRKGTERLYVLMVLGQQPLNDDLTTLLRAELKGKDPVSAAQAARTLGERRVAAAIPNLVTALAHADGRVRTGAAWALWRLAHPPVPPTPPGKPAAAAPPPPEAMTTSGVKQALLQAFEAGDGVERAWLHQSLHTLTGQDYRLDWAAWKKLLAGTPPDQIRAKATVVPYLFGIPIYGKRVAVVVDASTRLFGVHPFRPEKRLREVCEVPGAMSIPHFEILRARDFVRAHVERYLDDALPNTRFELVFFNTQVDGTFGKFAKVNGGARRRVVEAFEDRESVSGIATWDALNHALSIGGSSPSAQWKKGADEIVFITVNVPNAGDVVDPTQIASAIGLRGRMQAVRIHTVGVKTHPYDLCQRIALETTGTYRNYYK